MRKLLFLILLSSIMLTANAQRVVNHQALYWLRYQNQLLFSPTLYWNTEIESRRFFNPDVQNQFIIHSHLHYKKNKWDVGIGPTLSWAYAQKPALGYDHAVNEVRGVTEVAYEVPLGKIYFQNRIRLDHRFFQEETGKSVFEESLYVLRFRYRAQIRIPVKTNIENIPTIYLRLANEIMLNHTKNTFDQNRIYVTSDINISKKITLELAYIYIYQQRVGQDEYFERHVARFTVLHKISLY